MNVIRLAIDWKSIAFVSIKYRLKVQLCHVLLNKIIRNINIIWMNKYKYNNNLYLWWDLMYIIAVICVLYDTINKRRRGCNYNQM